MKKDLTFSGSCLQESVFSSASDAKIEAKPSTWQVEKTDFDPPGKMYAIDDPECEGLLPVQDPNKVVGWKEFSSQQEIIDFVTRCVRRVGL